MSPSMLTIRPAEAADAALVAEVNQQAWLSAYKGLLAPSYLESRSLEDQVQVWRDLLSEPSPSRQYFVAWDGSRVLGYTGGGRNADTHSPFQAELYGSAVLPSLYGQGIGSRLLGTQAQWLRFRGYNSMQLWIMVQNPFRRFYEKHGGQLLDQARELEFGGQRVTVVSYGWTELDKLVTL